MSTFTETGVDFRITLVRMEDGTPQVLLAGSSVMADGSQLRHLPEADLTASIPPDLMVHVQALMDAADAYLKATWEIA